ncbi:MAG: hypothetical protein RIR10_1264 [Planctomycetota bacterium]
MVDRVMMKRIRPLPLLILANIAALGLLATVELSKSAGAQAFRPRGTYTAASGRIPGTETHAVYIVDETTQEVIAVQWDPRSRQLQGLGYRNMSTDSADSLRPRSN